MPAADVAAALAVLVQDGQPLLMEPEPPKPVFEGRREREGTWDHDKGRRRDSDRGDRGRREPGGRRPRSGPPLVPYTIAVGKRHRVEPRQIVGALANEGGLNRSDFGHIDIRGDHSVVELPADLPPETWRALENTRISGRLIALQEGAAGPRRSPRSDRSDRPGGKPPRRDGGSRDVGDGGDTDGKRKKPRTKKSGPDAG